MNRHPLRLRDLFLVVVLLTLGTYRISAAQEAPKAAEPQPAPHVVERSYSEDFETVWNKVQDVLKEKGLFVHIHGNAVLDKEKGTITTPTLRYFKIWSAKAPVVERDYRDTYTITVIKAQEPGKAVKVKVQRKFEIFDPDAKPVPAWVEANPANEPVKVGISGEDILNTLQIQLASLPAARPRLPDGQVPDGQGQAGAAPEQ